MIQFAKWFARSAFGTGIAIGIILTMSFTPQITTQARAASAVAGAAANTTTDLEDYLQSLHSAVFGDSYSGDMPTFQLDSDFSESSWGGTYSVFNDAQEEASVELVFFHSWTSQYGALSETQLEDVATVGMVSATVIGTFYGEGGASHFYGTYISFRTDFGEGDRVHHLIPVAPASAAVIDAIVECNTLLAEEPLIADPTSPAAITLMGSMTQRAVCLFIAKANYNDCMDAAELDLINCLANAEITYAGIMAGCVVGIFVPVIGWGGAAVCAAGASGTYYAYRASCFSAHDSATTSCRNTYNTDKMACFGQYPVE